MPRLEGNRLPRRFAAGALGARSQTGRVPLFIAKILILVQKSSVPHLKEPRLKAVPLGRGTELFWRTISKIGSSVVLGLISLMVHTTALRHPTVPDSFEDQPPVVALAYCGSYPSCLSCGYF